MDKINETRENLIIENSTISSKQRSSTQYIKLKFIDVVEWGDK